MYENRIIASFSGHIANIYNKTKCVVSGMQLNIKLDQI